MPCVGGRHDPAPDGIRIKAIPLPWRAIDQDGTGELVFW